MPAARRAPATPRKPRPRSAPSAAPEPDRSDDGDELPGADRAHPKDLALELYRQRTLLAILGARLREVATSIERSRTLDFSRLRRALDVHHRLLIEVHRSTETMLADALKQVAAARPAVEECARQAARAEEFEAKLQPLLAVDASPTSDRVAAVAGLLRSEADRIDQHQLWEEENLHGRAGQWLPAAAQGRLLERIRRFDATRIDAEIALISWASQVHPSAD